MSNEKLPKDLSVNNEKLPDDLPKVDLASQALTDADVTTLQTVASSARFVLSLIHI